MGGPVGLDELENLEMGMGNDFEMLSDLPFKSVFIGVQNFCFE